MADYGKSAKQSAILVIYINEALLAAGLEAVACF
jgi:hypothetical protein